MKKILLLCLLCVPLTAATPPQKMKNVVVIENSSWTSKLEGFNAKPAAPSTQVQVETTNLIQGPMPTAIIGVGQSFRDDYFGTDQSTRYGVVQLKVRDGDANLATDATYQDSLGNYNHVDIPELPDPISVDQTAELTRIESGKTNGTWLALFAVDSPTMTTLDVYDERNVLVNREVVYAEAATFYELKTQVNIGRIVAHVGDRTIGYIGGEPRSRLFIVSFVGSRKGGSPRVGLPIQ
jgi:hypothetical protein